MIILASNSPRRKELLTLGGIDFTVKVSNVDESVPDGITKPSDVVKHLSRIKAQAVYDGENVVIGADTVVAIDDMILGKPADEADAKAMLKSLSGREHSVYTGVTIISPKGIDTFYNETKVEFYPLTDKEIEDYIATGEPMDKAGAYGIQGRGSVLVKGITGDYFNVVGLPLAEVVRKLKEL